MNCECDFVVVGEVCLDSLAGAPHERPGGSIYSAYAGTKVGARTAIIGSMGELDKDKILPTLRDYEIIEKYIQLVPGHTTRYLLQHVDEVLPLTASIVKNSHPIDIPNVFPETKAILFYPHPNIEIIIEQYPYAIKGLDVQYDIGKVVDLKGLSYIDVIFISSSDILSFTGKPLNEIVDFFLNKGVKIVVTKFGPGGSCIYQRDKERIDIPAFKSHYKWTVGAGDVYNAVFLIKYMESENVKNAGLFASLSAAYFIENFEFDKEQWMYDEMVKNREKVFVHPEMAEKEIIYLAGPFFSQGERTIVSLVYHALKKCGFCVYSPLHEDGIVDGFNKSFKAFKNNISAIKEASILVAILDNEDPGTVWECGYAYAIGKPIFAIQTIDKKLNLMTEFGPEVICPSLRCLVDSLYNRYARKDT
ncbi:MAG: putative sugar kinase YdjH [Pelotomaculum sp. PtaU1.Bin065]|nr:MAG: putative sugar kinase YdjH [Pelotomaculum sp. PtaU1.Bin065]